MNASGLLRLVTAAEVNRNREAELIRLRANLNAVGFPVNPAECWSWSMDPSQRKLLKQIQWRGARLPVKLQARELGADLSYCLRKAAQVRNGRIQVTHQRLLRLSGIPGSRAQKQRLLLSGVWPQGLHAAETATVPRTVFKRLRTKTSVALNLNRKGSNPYLVCMLACPKIVDPQFVLLCNRISLFRQVLRELPDYKDMFVAKTLLLLGWTVQQGAIVKHEDGRFFHLFMSPFKQICSLLSSTWADHVCEQIHHRKGLEAIEGIDLTLTKSMPGLHPSEKGLVICQQTGAFFTEDTRRHCGGTGQCPKCHQPDSRNHRLEDCPQVLHVRNAFPSLLAQWGTLSEQVKYYGLIPEPPDY